jgi:hypothetical protein
MVETKYVGVNERGYRIGRWHQNSRLSDAEVDALRAMHEDEGLTIREAAKRSGISFWTARALARYLYRSQSVAGFKKVKGAGDSGRRRDD